MTLPLENSFLKIIKHL